MARQLLIGTAMAVAIALGWLAWEGLLYLQRGYSLGVSMANHHAGISHVDFPRWRAGIHVLLWGAATAGVIAYVTGRLLAPIAAWLTFFATVAIGTYDVVQYGTVGAPTSVWTVLLLLLFALLTRFGPLIRR